MITPLSADDLRRIAKSLSDFERLLYDAGGYKARAEFITRIEVTRPDDSEVIGHFTLEDGWLGFMPLEVTR